MLSKSRYFLLGLLLMASACATTTSSAKPVSTNAASETIAGAFSVFRTYRLSVGANGEPLVEVKDFRPPVVKNALGDFRHIDLGAGTIVRLISAPANAVLPVHTSVGHELFLTLEGGSTIVLSNGREVNLTPGVLGDFDDAGARRSGRIGPNGAIYLQIVPPQAPAK